MEVQFSSVPQSCPTLCSPMDCSMPGFSVHHQLPHFTQTHVHWVSDAIQPSHLCHPLLLRSVFLSIRVFSSESVLCIRWSKYWSFSFSISPSNEYLGLISFTMDWLDLLAVQGTLKSLLQHHNSEASIQSIKCWILPRKDTPRPRAKEKPQQDCRRGKIMFRIKPHTHQRHLEGSNKPCAHQDPETP